MTVSRDTGEIHLFRIDDSVESDQESSKIIHLEVGFDKQMDNHQLSFIHFIEYLYNGLLTIEVRDYSTGLSFGSFLLPLRSLIRKRRNEVIFIHEDYIYHHNTVRTKVRL